MVRTNILDFRKCNLCGKRFPTVHSMGDVIDPMDLMTRKLDNYCPECKKGYVKSKENKVADDKNERCVTEHVQ